MNLNHAKIAVIGLGCHAALIFAGLRINDTGASRKSDETVRLILDVGHHRFMVLVEAGMNVLGQTGAEVFDVQSIPPLRAADSHI